MLLYEKSNCRKLKVTFNFMRSLHDVHKINVYMAGHVCLTVLSAVCPHDSTTGQIWTKFGMVVVPLRTNLK